MELPNYHCNLCLCAIVQVMNHKTKVPDVHGIAVIEDLDQQFRPRFRFTRAFQEFAARDIHICDRCTEALVLMVAAAGQKLLPAPESKPEDVVSS